MSAVDGGPRTDQLKAGCRYLSKARNSTPDLHQKHLRRVDVLAWGGALRASLECAAVVCPSAASAVDANDLARCGELSRVDVSDYEMVS